MQLRQAIVQLCQDLQPDAQLANMVPGRVEGIVETAVLDWPGRADGAVPDESIYQVLEPELMFEGGGLLSDLTGFPPPNLLQSSP